MLHSGKKWSWGRKTPTPQQGLREDPPRSTAVLRHAHNTTKAVKGTPGSHKAQKQELSTCKHFCFFVDLPEKWSNCYSRKTHRVSTYLQRASASHSRAGGTDQRARRHPFTCCSQLLLGGGGEGWNPKASLESYLICNRWSLCTPQQQCRTQNRRQERGGPPRRRPEWDFNKEPGGNGPSTTTS